MASVASEVRRGSRPAPAVVQPVLEAWRNPLVQTVVRRLILAIPLLIAVSALASSCCRWPREPGAGDPRQRSVAQQVARCATCSDSTCRCRSTGTGSRRAARRSRYLDLLRPAGHAGDHPAPAGDAVADHRGADRDAGHRRHAGGLQRGARWSRSVGSSTRFALIGFALPSFWLGAILIELFAVKLHLFPAVGYVPIASSPCGSGCGRSRCR